jgi:hypothetical protein
MPRVLYSEYFTAWRQVARLQREERLGALSLELANKKALRLSELRGFTRAVRARHQASMLHVYDQHATRRAFISTVMLA